jgi:hypothetical protein
LRDYPADHCPTANPGTYMMEVSRPNAVPHTGVGLTRIDDEPTVMADPRGQAAQPVSENDGTRGTVTRPRT